MSIHSYYAVITPTGNQFYVSIPDLNCSATSTNFIEAIETAEELIRECLISKVTNYKYFPPASTLKDLIIPNGTSLIHISVNTGFI